MSTVAPIINSGLCPTSFRRSFMYSMAILHVRLHIPLTTFYSLFSIHYSLIPNFQSFNISLAASMPAAPITPPPGCAPLAPK